MKKAVTGGVEHLKTQDSRLPRRKRDQRLGVGRRVTDGIKTRGRQGVNFSPNAGISKDRTIFGSNTEYFELQLQSAEKNCQPKICKYYMNTHLSIVLFTDTG